MGVSPLRENRSDGFPGLGKSAPRRFRDYSQPLFQRERGVTDQPKFLKRLRVDALATGTHPAFGGVVARLRVARTV